MITDVKVDDADLIARHPERGMVPDVPPAKCHPDLPQWSSGLCRDCWLRRHEADPGIIAAKREHQREIQARWYAENAERKRATQRAQYQRNKAAAEKEGMKTYIFIQSRRVPRK